MKNLNLSLAFLLVSTGALSAGLETNIESLRSYNGKSIKAFIGFVDLIEGAEGLIKDQGNNPILDLQRLMEGVTSLVEARINDCPVNEVEQQHLIGIINNFKDQINTLVHNKPTKSSLDVDADANLEHKKLMEGLVAILYNAVYMLIDSKSMSNCLLNILNGVYKVVSAILADDKIDYNDWRRLLEALASIFNLNRFFNHSA